MSSSSGLRDGLSPGAATNTTSRSNSAIRSRTRRLVSFNDDDEENSGTTRPSSALSSSLASDRQSARSRGATPSPFTSRGASPLPMSHPSRATESVNNRGRQNGGGGGSSGAFSHDGKDQLGFAESSRAAVDLLDASWSSLQSLASSVLGSDIARPAASGNPRAHARKPSRLDPWMRNTSRTSTPLSWGPSSPGTPEIGSGTREERQAYVQAKKREALLLADTGPSISGSTRHKRRDSGDNTAHSVIDPDQDEEALVYIHHVQKTDTMTSVTIRYGCQPAIFRKANGFWPSDSIQSRKTVLLPVDSCSVKGRPVRSKTNTDLLDSAEDLNGSSISPAPDGTDRKETTLTEVEGDRVWKPESWVQIDNFTDPVEIGRVPRRALGFFPRTRRKSISYSDAESPSTSKGTTTNTASSSVSSLHDSQSSQSTVVPPSRPHVGPPGSKKPGARHQRQRSNIQLAGPGVGTLDRSAMAPGPALDGLSKFLSQHLPTLAPPPPPTTNPDSGAFESTSTTHGTAANSLDNIGGAFEGWFKKVTTRAKAGLNELQQTTSNPGSGRLQPTTTESDLIEMDDGLESRNDYNLLGEPGRKPYYNRAGSSASALGDRNRNGTSRTRTTGGSSYKDD